MGVTAPGDHYFTAAPASADERRTIDVTLGGRSWELTTAPGVFSADHLDAATRILLDTVPPPPARGTLLDLGCGWGPIALTLALRSPSARVLAVDVNDRALDLSRRNADTVGARNLAAMRPEEVPGDARFEVIWSNPPIRIGKAALHDLLLTWLERLTDDGVAYLVVAKNLGSDSLARWLAGQGYAVERLTSSKGFRVLQVSGASQVARPTSTAGPTSST